ncbi:MAG: aspartate carbamoyltransferase regulatory subunit [Nitrososphaerales archaeon]|nr:aspartate carbamoyltransferase regulatory subunit [Nitrososphaerales archaeon]
MSKEQLVRKIKEGTVLDHVEQGRALQVLQALNIDGKNGNIVTVAMNVSSKKLRKKDIIKIENRFLKPEETNRIALIAPRATVNLIRDYQVFEKRKVEIPDTFVNVFKCPNPTCISNSNEPVSYIIDAVRKNPPLLRCRYCGRLLSPNELI